MSGKNRVLKITSFRLKVSVSSWYKAELQAGGLPGTCVFHANWMDIIMIAYSVELICRVYGDEDPLHLPPALLTFLLPHFSLLTAAFLLSCFSSHLSSPFHPGVLILSPRTPMTPRVFLSSPLLSLTPLTLVWEKWLFY